MNKLAEIQKIQKKILWLNAGIILLATLLSFFVGIHFFKQSGASFSLEKMLLFLMVITIPSILVLFWKIIPLFKDIIESEKAAEEKLQFMAYHDPLTKLANRHKLEQYINHILAYAYRNNRKFAVVFIDLDHFKNINDTIGHEAGDMLLKVVSERLKNTVRSVDIVARLGGDEFVLVVTDISDAESVAKIAKKILDVLLKPIYVHGHELYITTSIGISLYPYDGQDIQTLMKNSDLALYRAKEHGRNNFQFCTPEMTAKAQQKMMRQNALNHAVLKNEFLLHYQPKFNLTRQSVSGFEALLRWNSQEFGLVTPDEIIQLAEETGLIIPISEWVLKTACLQVNEWHRQYPHLTLSVNLSSRQFKHSDFINKICAVLEETHFPAHLLELEITESVFMHDPETAMRVLHALKKIGISISLDDFGTGYSSMNYLKRFSIDQIKIDRVFTNQILTDEASASIINAMIAMAKKLRIKTVAEGVETKEQFEFLLKEGCSEVQGYYLSPPLETNKVIPFLKDPLSFSSLYKEFPHYSISS